MKNHMMVNGQLLQMNKTFAQLKEHQKIKIAEWLFEKYSEIRMARNSIPNSEEDDEIIAVAMNKIAEAKIWIPEHEVAAYYSKKKTKYAQRYEKEHQIT